MAKEKKRKKNEDFSIPDSAMVLPSSTDATARTRQKGVARPIRAKGKTPGEQ